MIITQGYNPLNSTTEELSSSIPLFNRYWWEGVKNNVSNSNEHDKNGFMYDTK